MQKLFSILAAVVTVLSMLGGLLQAINPRMAIILMGVSGVISAATPALQKVLNDLGNNPGSPRPPSGF